MAKIKVENTIFPREWSMNYGGKLFTFQQVQVMGIVNCTPDSFYSASQKRTTELQFTQIEKHVNAGATWLDLGAYSSRPGATDISVSEEILRLEQALRYCRQNYPDLLISVDTFRSEVAEYVLSDGPAVINDVSGGLLDSKMFDIAAKYKAPLILMHMRGTPRNMMENCVYDNLVEEVIMELAIQVKKAQLAGVKDIIIDPGFGFAKTTQQNFQLLKQMDLLHVLGFPLLVGLSRKSMIYKTLENNPEDALNGTSVLHTLAIQRGCSLIRVHDVKEAFEVIELLKAINEA